MEIETGDIILLTRRKLDWKIHRYILSLFIHILTGKYTHTAIVYNKWDGSKYIREMEYDGVRINQSLKSYLEEYEDRVYILKPTLKLLPKEINILNNLCYSYYSYEYLQIFWQAIRAITGKFIGKKTKFKRNCSEDTARIYNTIRPNIFKKPYQITPMEIGESIHFKVEKYNGVC